MAKRSNNCWPASVGNRRRFGVLLSRLVLGVGVYESKGCLQTESSCSKLTRALRSGDLVWGRDYRRTNRRNFMSGKKINFINSMARGSISFGLFMFLAGPSLALAAGVHALFNLDRP